MIRAVAVVSLGLALAACGTSEPAPASPSRSTPPTTTTKPAPKTFADFAEDPCAVLSKDDQLSLGVVAGGEDPTPTDPHACSWVAGPGVVLFTAFPESDQVPVYTAKPGASPLTVGGRPAVQIVVGQTCFTAVTVAATQSFRVGATGDAADPCQATVDFATTIVANVG